MILHLKCPNCVFSHANITIDDLFQYCPNCETPYIDFLDVTPHQDELSKRIFKSKDILEQYRQAKKDIVKEIGLPQPLNKLDDVFLISIGIHPAK